MALQSCVGTRSSTQLFSQSDRVSPSSLPGEYNGLRWSVASIRKMEISKQPVVVPAVYSKLALASRLLSHKILKRTMSPVAYEKAYDPSSVCSPLVRFDGRLRHDVQCLNLGNSVESAPQAGTKALAFLGDVSCTARHSIGQHCHTPVPVLERTY